MKRMGKRIRQSFFDSWEAGEEWKGVYFKAS